MHWNSLAQLQCNTGSLDSCLWPSCGGEPGARCNEMQDEEGTLWYERPLQARGKQPEFGQQSMYKGQLFEGVLYNTWNSSYQHLVTLWENVICIIPPRGLCGAIISLSQCIARQCQQGAPGPPVGLPVVFPPSATTGDLNGQLACWPLIPRKNGYMSVMHSKKAQFRQISPNIQRTFVFHNPIQKYN